MRRHLIGLGLAVAMFLVMFFGGAWGYLRLLRLPAAATAPVSALPAHGGSLLTSSDVIFSMGAVVATGVIAGILVAWPRISPLAAGLPGLVALAWTALYMVSVKQAVALIPLKGHAFGAGWEALLFNGILGFAGLAMVVPMCLPARWGNPYAEEEAEAEADASDAQDYMVGLKENVAAESAGARDSAGAHRRSEVLTGRPIPPAGQRLTGGQARVSGAQTRVTGSQPQMADARVTGVQQRVTSSQQQLTADELSAQLRMSGAQRRITGAQQRLYGGQRPTGGQRLLSDQQGGSAPWERPRMPGTEGQ